MSSREDSVHVFFARILVVLCVSEYSQMADRSCAVVLRQQIFQHVYPLMHLQLASQSHSSSWHP